MNDLRRAAAEARRRHPEITRILLAGSLARGDWTADSDADLIVVVRRGFRDLFDRSRYQITSRRIPTDTLVYSEQEYAALTGDRSSPLAEALASAIEL